MRNVWAACLLLMLFAVAAPVPAMAQAPPPRIVSSIDIMVLNSESVVVGKLTQARQVSDNLTDVTITVEQRLKGTPAATTATLDLQQDSRWGNQLPLKELSRLATDKARVLVVGKGIIPFDDKGLAIPAANGKRLGEAKQVIAHIQEVLRSHPPNDKGKAASFSISLPRKLADGSIPRALFDSNNSGPATLFLVPVDGTLEAWALKEIRSSRTGDDLYSPFQALSSFKSASNVELLKGLLSDPRHYLIKADDNNGVEVHIYRVREAANRLLVEWNVDFVRPLLREDIPRFETLKTFPWSLGQETGGHFDQVAARAKNLEELTINSAGRPTPEQLAKIAQMRSLTRLTLGGTDKRPALESLSGLVNLEEVTFRLAGLTDRDLGPLFSLPKLHTLNLESNRITDAGLKALAGIRTLKRITVTSNSAITAAGIAEVRALRPDLEIKR